MNIPCQDYDSLRTIIHHNPDGMLVVDSKEQVLFANPAAILLLGREYNQLINTHFGLPLIPDEPLEVDIIQPSGVTLVAEMRVVRFEWEGADAFLVSLRDVTERHRAEAQRCWDLKVNQALVTLYKPLSSHISTFQDIAETVLQEAKALTNSTHGYVSIIDPLTGDNVWLTLTEMLKNECSVSGTERRVSFPKGPDGRYNGLWGHSLNTHESFFTNDPYSHPSSIGLSRNHSPLERFLSVPVLLDDELVGQIALANAMHDYTQRDLDAIQRLAEFYALAIQRKRIEDALKDSEQNLIKARDFHLSLLNQAPALIWRSGLDGLCDWFNATWLNFTGRSFEQELGEGWAQGVHPDDFDRCLKIYKEAFNSRGPFEMEYRLRRHDGNFRWIVDYGIPFNSIQGQFAGYIGYCFDITGRKVADAAIRQSLEEKETLLKEVHHRVKNNLQIVSSLLNLQVMRSTQPELADVLRLTQNRIQSMALLHETLYTTGNLTRLDLVTYIERILNQVCSSVAYERQNIRFHRCIDKVELCLDQVIPCGLIINELITNSLKYAFPGGRPGNIYIHLEPTVNRKVLLKISDDGIGMQYPGNSETKSLGLELVKSLVRQLKGTLEYSQNPGATFCIEFKNQTD